MTRIITMKISAIRRPSGAVYDRHRDRVGEDSAHEREERSAALAAATPLGEGDCDGRGGHQGEDASGVSTGLVVDVGAEQDRDHSGDQREYHGEWPGQSSPVWCHAVAGEVAGHDVEQTGHGAGAGEPEDADGGGVVGSAEAVAEPLVGEVGERAAVGLAALFELGGWDQQGCDEG
jgi:hypothetical protein